MGGKTRPRSSGGYDSRGLSRWNLETKLTLIPLREGVSYFPPETCKLPRDADLGVFGGGCFSLHAHLRKGVKFLDRHPFEAVPRSSGLDL